MSAAVAYSPRRWSYPPYDPSPNASACTGTMFKSGLISDFDEQGESAPKHKLPEYLPFFSDDESGANTARDTCRVSGLGYFQSWIERIVEGLIEGADWESLIHKSFEKAYARWYTFRLLSIESAANSAMIAKLTCEPSLTLLLKAPSHLRNDIFRAVSATVPVEEILPVAQKRYSKTADEGYLLVALSLLEQAGSRAWPSLKRLARSRAAECELFVGLVARCRGVSESERVEGLKEIAANPITEVRASIFQYLHGLSAEHRKEILELLANDSAEEIFEEAKDRLVEFD